MVNISAQALTHLYENFLALPKPSLPTETMQNITSKATTLALDYARNNPKMTAVQVVSVVLSPFLGWGWMLKGVLNVVGFGPLGPIADTLATWCQARVFGGHVPAGSLFAACQRFAMGA